MQPHRSSAADLRNVRIPETLGVIFGIAFGADVVLTAFCSLEPGRFRRAFDRAVRFGVRCFVIYLCAALLFATFQGPSRPINRSMRVTLANMFAVTLAVAVVAVFLVDFLPERHRRATPSPPAASRDGSL